MLWREKHEIIIPATNVMDSVGNRYEQRRQFLKRQGIYIYIYIYYDRLCGLVVRVLGYRSGGAGSISGTTRKKSSGSGTGSTQPREYN
jgi:hypothetical protein